MNIEKLKHYLIMIVTPSAWVSTPSVNEVDTLVNSIIDDGEYMIQDNYTIKYKYCGKVFALRISNYPYAYGDIYYIDGIDQRGKGLPYIQTRTKLRAACIKNMTK